MPGGGVNMADAGNLPQGIAAGPHVAHVYADSESLSLSESWMLDGNTCRAKVVVGRQIDADAPALSLPAPEASYPFEILSRGAFSLLVPGRGSRRRGWHTLYVQADSGLDGPCEP